MSRHRDANTNLWRSASIAALVLAVLLAACGKSAAPDSADAKAPAKEAIADEEGVALSAEEITALGLTTAAARAVRSSPEVRGFATVLPHDAIAQGVAELRTAMAAERQSQSALERVKQLAETPGAMAAETRETAERQAAADRAALELAEQRLSATLGQDPPWKDPADSSELQALATGKSKLVRITLPVDAIGDRMPASVRVARVAAAQGGRSWQLQSIWRAPADPAVSGVTLFALLGGGDIGEGEHLLAWVPAGSAESGVAIPASAAVITGGRFFCYVERKPGIFERLEFDPGRSVDGGYFVKEGIAAGEKIVVSGAGQLLARETNPSKEAD